VLLDEAMRPTRRFFRQIYPPIAIPITLAATALTVGQAWFMADLFTMGSTVEDDFTGFFGLWAIYMGLVVVLMVLTMIGFTVMIAGVCDALTGEPIDMGRRWKWGFSLKVLGTTLLVGIIIVLGMMCCLLPGVLLGVIYGFTIPVMVLESRYGTAALSRSYRLVTHNPGGQLSTHPGWRVLAIGVVSTLLSYLVSLVVSLPFVIAQQIGMVRSFAEDPEALANGSMQFSAIWLWLQVPQTILTQMTNIAIWLYSSFVLVGLFEALRGRKEGVDLDAALDDLGAPEHPEPGT
jgi:hypothetical protein